VSASNRSGTSQDPVQFALHSSAFSKEIKRKKKEKKRERKGAFPEAFQ
jgi:hypothetical protein